MTSVGVTSWGQKSQTNNNKGEDLRRFSFMKLTPGNNIVRIVTAPFRFEFARVHGPKARSFFGDRVNVAAPDVCPARAGGIFIGERYYAGVLDLKDKSNPEVKILDMSTLIYDSLTGILESLKEEHERDVSPSEFSINIKYDKGAKNPGLTYNVIQRSIEPLTEAQQALVDEAMEDLVKVLTVKSGYYKPETVQKKLDEIGWTKEIQAEVDAKAKKSKKSDEGLKASDDDDYSFDKPEQAEETASAAN